MSSITCQVITALNNHPVAGLQVSLRCLDPEFPQKFRGCTNFDGELQRWHPATGRQSLKVEHVLEKFGEKSSVWQVSFDTWHFFGAEKTCWPAVEVTFNLIPENSCAPRQAYHLGVVLGSYEYQTGLSLRPLTPSRIEHAQYGINTPPATPILSAVPDPSNLALQPQVSEVINKRKSPERLSELQRDVLLSHYSVEQYPDEETLCKLSANLGIKRQKIKAWFCRRRYRNGVAKFKKNQWQLNVMFSETSQGCDTEQIGSSPCMGETSILDKHTGGNFDTPRNQLIEQLNIGVDSSNDRFAIAQPEPYMWEASLGELEMIDQNNKAVHSMSELLGCTQSSEWHTHLQENATSAQLDGVGHISPVKSDVFMGNSLQEHSFIGVKPQQHIQRANSDALSRTVAPTKLLRIVETDTDWGCDKIDGLEGTNADVFKDLQAQSLGSHRRGKRKRGPKGRFI